MLSKRPWFVVSIAVLALMALGCSDTLGGAGPSAQGGNGGGSGGGVTTCLPGQVTCGGVCVDVSSSNANCGACDSPCSGGAQCSAATCSCSSELTLCDGQCQDLASNAASCGECGRACGAGSSCEAGVCACQPGLSECGGQCANLMTDGANCGACGAACPVGQGCSAGTCGCPTGFTSCADSCVDLTSDESHCGGCGTACQTGQLCATGTCECYLNLTACAQGCVDTQSDGANCGACGNVCPAGQVCSNGTCAGDCNDQTLCGTSCVDPTSNVQHCGACDNACQSGQTCNNGVCSCGPGEQACAGSCVDVADNPAHCGACGNVCTGGQACSGGTCSCPAGELCGGQCTDVSSSPQHCGACNNPCVGGASCNQGTCDCPEAQELCDTTCVDTQTDSANCGSCGTICQGGSACNQGSCGCPSGQESCDDTCVNTETDAAHCGSCGNACASGESCAAGACMGGMGGTGGTSGTGGMAGTGGTSGTGGMAGTGGTGGTSGTGGTGGSPTTGLPSCRGVVAVQASGGVFVSWRLKATDPADLAFNVYRDTTKVNAQPITNSTNLLDAAGSAGARYMVRPVQNGTEQGDSETTTALAQNYVRIPLNNQNPVQAGRLVGVGDLDGDCEYDFVVKRGNGDHDVTQVSTTGETFKLEAYKRDGTFLWRRDMGPNIETGVWFSPFIVYDLDSDGRAEVIAKGGEVPTSLGGDGDLNGDGITNYRQADGHVPLHSISPSIEYLEVYDGMTGALRARTPWIPIGPWGSDGNRYGRNMMAPAYLDGQNPSVLIFRGGNSRIEVQAFDFRNNALTRRWVWSRANSNGAYGHNVRIGDIDDDGKDEIVHFSIAIDDNGGSNGSVIWDTGQAHGDRVHLTDIDPSRPGQEIFYIQEFSDVYTDPVHLRDARTGARIWGQGTTAWADVGRGVAADFTASSPGMEAWASPTDSRLYSATGQDIGPRPSGNPNMAIWWDADPVREHITTTRIEKLNATNGSWTALLTASGCAAGSRDIPMGYADILGDWREEAWWLCNNNTELRVYVSTAVTDRRLYTFMQDPQYRTSVASMTMGYVQATQPSFFVGNGMAAPPAPRLAIPAGR